jgi:OsmC subfamily peroxiredoxin
MATRNGSTKWIGDLKMGPGELTVGEGAWTSAYSGRSRFAGVLPRFEDGEGTNPEELLAAAHAACFAMALSLGLSDAGHPPSSIKTTARVHLHVVGCAPTIHQIDLKTEADVPGWNQEEFQDHAERAKTSCIISRALGGVRQIKPGGPGANEGDAMQIRFPGESAEYRMARDRLLEREIELRRAMEAVAVSRRALPPGGAVPEDYVFETAGPDGKAIQVRLSELFAPGKDSLVIYNFMFPRGYGGPRPGPTSGETAFLPLEEGPCPSCVALLDQLDGAAGHVSNRLNLAVVAKTSLARLLTFGKERGWRHLRLLSSVGNTYNRDYFGEDEEGWQTPMLNVFHREGEMIRHFWGAELTYAPADPGQDHRSVGTLEPLWNLFDLTREGRPMDWDEQLSYQ